MRKLTTTFLWQNIRDKTVNAWGKCALCAKEILSCMQNSYFQTISSDRKKNQSHLYKDFWGSGKD
jgi:hypothetical protein